MSNFIKLTDSTTLPKSDIWINIQLIQTMIPYMNSSSVNSGTEIYMGDDNTWYVAESIEKIIEMIKAEEKTEAPLLQINDEQHKKLEEENKQLAASNKDLNDAFLYIRLNGKRRITANEGSYGRNYIIIFRSSDNKFETNSKKDEMLKLLGFSDTDKVESF